MNNTITISDLLMQSDETVADACNTVLCYFRDAYVRRVACDGLFEVSVTRGISTVGVGKRAATREDAVMNAQNYLWDKYL